MAARELKVHEVRYLSATNAKIDGEPVVVITIRPDEDSFRPHNLGLLRSQAERLLEDLKIILGRSAVCLVLLGSVGCLGCSADVRVERETTSATPRAESTDNSRTAVSVSLFTDEAGKPVEMPSDGVLIVEGCVHLHQHLHISLNEDDRNSERIAVEIVREWVNGKCDHTR